MKKIITLIVVLFMFGCSKQDLEVTTIDHNQYINVFDSMPVGISDQGIYYITDGILYYKADDEETVPIDPVTYIDGNKSIITDGEFKYSQIDTFTGQDIICCGDRLYLEYHTDKFDGSSYYSLCSVNLKGEDFQTHIIYDFVPQRTVINNGKIYVMYDDMDNKQCINIYNNQFKLIDTQQFSDEKNAMSFYCLNDELMIPDVYHFYESNNIDVIYRIENIYSEQDRKVISTFKNGDYTITFENKLVLFVTDQYFYTSSCTYPQTYERYKLNGELDQAIIIKDHIASYQDFTHLLTSDFSYIVKMRNEDIVYGHSNQHLFEVDFSKGTCKYVDE